MKRQRSEKRTKNDVKLWTYPEAVQAVPYVASILRSLREHALAVNRLQLQAKRLADRPGRKNRSALIDFAEAQRQAEKALDQYQEALDELLALGVGCLDPIQGEAVFPFLHEDKVAWFSYALFDGPPIKWWRFDSDSPETRRLVFSEMKDKELQAV